MADKKQTRTGTPQTQGREDRLKSALKANLARRKAQARARAVQSEDKNENDKGEG